MAIYHVLGTRLALGMQDEKTDKILALEGSEMGTKHHMVLFVGVCSEWEVTCQLVARDEWTLDQVSWGSPGLFTSWPELLPTLVVFSFTIPLSHT